jgi:hypothetical protein
MPPETVPWLRYGLTVDSARLIDEVGYRPRSTPDTVRDFIEKLRGHRVLPGIDGMNGSGDLDRAAARDEAGTW